MNKTWDAFETVECPGCGSQVMLIDLIDVKIHDDKDVYSDELGYLGDCPVCDSQIFVENIS